MPLLSAEQVFQQMIAKLGPLPAKEVAKRKQAYMKSVRKVIAAEQKPDRKRDQDEDGEIKKPKRVVFLNSTVR